MADYRLPFTGEQVENILTNSTPQSDLTTEINRAELAEQTLQGNINTEAETRGQADTTLQGNIDAEETRAKAAEKANADDIDAIEEKIPTDASSANKLVTTNTMNSSIATATATWRGTYNLVSDLHLTISATEADIVNALSATIATVDNNDYCYVLIPVANDDPTKIARIDRYKFNGTTWGLEYTLNNSGFTAAQWEAINSGITSGLVAKLGLLPTKAELDILLAAKAPQATTYTKAEVDALIANFITASVNNLVNYYLKTDTYTKAEVQQLIDAVKQFTYQSVSTLPTASADTMNKIYLVPSTNPETRNVKDEFITIAVTDQGTTTYSWEQIGSTTIDLSGYYTSLQTDAAIANALAAYSTTDQMNTAITTAINTALADYSTTSQMTAAIATAIANYYTKAEVDALIANFITASVNNLVNYYLKSETFTKAEVNQLIAAVQQFTYQSVAELPTASADTMNKIYLVPSTNPKTKNVKDEYITISVTDQGATTYSWEQIGSTTVDLSGYYTSAQTDTAISNALASYSTTQQMNTAITNALNTALADYSTTSQMTAAIATAIASYYTKSEVDALIANFITKSVNDLVNYYLKSEVFTKTEVNTLIAAIQQFQYVSVTTLPTASADTMNKIYLVPSTNPGTQNVKDEYITIAVTDQGTTTYSWEVIGSTDIDLANYYTKQQTDGAITHALNTALADYTTTANLTTLLQGKQDTLTFDDAPTENSNNPVKSGGIYSALTGKEPVITNMAKKGFGKGTCSTAAATQAKTVTISNFLLLTNCIVTVYFQNAVGVTAATLNVSDTGAKPIMINGVTPQPGVIPPKSTVMLQYDGTNWNVISIQQLDLSFSPDYLFVDMGLPSGLMWAKRNIDVTQPNGFAASEFQFECSFFSWGNVECHNPISDSAFDYDFGSSNEGPYASTPGAALTGDASLSYDAARINCGAPWRLPTTSEFEELFNNIDYIDANGDVIDPSQTNKLVTVNGIVGLFLKSKVNGNRLFFPCSGYGFGTSWNFHVSHGNYWSSSLFSATNGRFLDFNSGGVYPQNYNYRFHGFAGRAVQ